MLSTEVILAIASAILLIGAVISWLFHRHSNNYSYSSSSQTSGLHFSQEQYPSKMFDIDMLIKPDDTLRKLFFANPDHESTYKAILRDSELIKKIRSSKNEDEARKLLIDWLDKHQSSKESKEKGEGNTSKSNKKKEVEETKQTKPESIPESQSPKDPAPVARNEITPLNPKVVDAYKEIVKLLDEHNIDRIIAFIKDLPDSTIRMIIQDYARVRVVQNSVKADLLLSRAKGKRDIILSVEQEVINGLKDKFESLKGRISALRKKGENVNHEDLLLGMIQPKIKAFSFTLEKTDLSKVQDLFANLDKEISLKENILTKK